MLGRKQEAEQALELVVAGGHGGVKTWRNLGVMAVDRADWDHAVSCCKTALSLDSSTGDLNHCLAVALEGQGNLEGALNAARDAVVSQPYCKKYLTLYIAQMKRLGREAETRAFLQDLHGHGEGGQVLEEGLSCLQDEKR
jgi:tetratricopeptide (TPR) repeat protein